MKGILVANLGSPNSPRLKDVRRFLSEFLMDGHVINAPPFIRRVLVKCLIVPFRSRRTAKAYASIWANSKGPLRKHTEAIARAIENRTGIKTTVGMRYGEPSLEAAFRQLADAEEILLVGLHPQHADSTRTTLNERAASLASKASLRVLLPFYKEPQFIESMVQVTRSHLHTETDHILFSFHGLPVQHILKADETHSHCYKHSNCCDTPSPCHAKCYRHQCCETAYLVGEQLDIEYSVSFQSRLGRLEWIKPYTEERIVELAEQGVRRLAVVCPSFVTDNLETLEEIGIRAEQSFIDHGGIHFQLVPSLNDDNDWMDVLAYWCKSVPELFESLPSQINCRMRKANLVT